MAQNSEKNQTITEDAERFFIEHRDLEYLKSKVSETIDRIVSCYRAGGKILLCGNGGSASDCGHIAGELMKGFKLKRRLTGEDARKIREGAPENSTDYIDALQGALPAISLTAHDALLSAYSNDVSWEMAFAQQVYGYAKPGDLLVALSTTGQSANVIHAARIAKIFGTETIAMTGMEGGTLMEIADITLNVPHIETYRVQEYHMALYHFICEMVEKEMFGEN